VQETATGKHRADDALSRADVAKLLDAVEDESGPVAADFTLSIIRNIANWYASRHEDYQSPVVRGMRRTNPRNAPAPASSMTMSCVKSGRPLNPMASSAHLSGSPCCPRNAVKSAPG
jgi:hypothetical protein